MKAPPKAAMKAAAAKANGAVTGLLRLTIQTARELLSPIVPIMEPTVEPIDIARGSPWIKERASVPPAQLPRKAPAAEPMALPRFGPTMLPVSTCLPSVSLQTTS